MSQQITIPGIGDTLADNYRILEELGRGSYGVVFKAEHLGDGRVVAVKTLLPQSVLDPEVITRFEREAQLVARLNHEAIISLIDYGQKDGLFYMSMEYVEGRDLSELLKQDAPVSPDEAFEIVRQILSALDHAHQQGIVHRDLKPANILLRPGLPGQPEQIKVLDFGIAKMVHRDGEDYKTLTQAGHVLGTPHYMSPEQIAGDIVDARADLYSVGIILYELLVGQHPFEGTSSTAVMVAHLRDDPPPLPGALERSKWGEAVRAALEKQPDDRVTTAAHFLEIISREEQLMSFDTQEVTDIFNKGSFDNLGHLFQPPTTPALSTPPNFNLGQRQPERVKVNSHIPRPTSSPSFGARPVHDEGETDSTLEWSKTGEGADYEALERLRAQHTDGVPGVRDTGDFVGLELDESAFAQRSAAPAEHVIAPAPPAKTSSNKGLIAVILLLCALLVVGIAVLFSTPPPAPDNTPKPPIPTAKKVEDKPTSKPTNNAGMLPPPDDKQEVKAQPPKEDKATVPDPETEPDKIGATKPPEPPRDTTKPDKPRRKSNVTFTIEVSPPSAKAEILVGDKVKGIAAPTKKLKLPKSDDRVTIRVQAKGYVTQSQTLAPNRDRRVKFKLKATMLEL